MRCNGAFRFDELVAFADRAGRRRAVDGPLRADRRARRRQARRPRGATSARTSRTCSQRSIPGSSSACDSRSATRRRRRRVRRRRRRARFGHDGSRARRHASSAATTTAPSSSARGCERDRGAIVDTQGATIGVPRRLLAVHAGPAARPARQRAPPALRPGDGCGDEHRDRGHARASRDDASFGHAGACTARRRGRGQAALPLGGRSRRRHATADGFTLELAEPAYGVARGQVAVVYDDDAVVGAGRDHGRRLTEPLGSPR